jgi:hypothetical protein
MIASINLFIWTIAYNNEKNIIKWCDSLKLTCPITFQILNQGNPISKKTQNHIKCKIINCDNKPLAKAWNWCVSQSPTEWVLISNDDVEFTTGWWEAFQKYKERYLWIGPSHCFCINKKLFKKIGPFDENFSYFGFEDDDYLIRMRKSKLPIMYGTSNKFPYKGDRFAKFIIHHHKDRIDFGENNPNHQYFYKKWKGEIPYWKNQKLIL